jgi:glycerol-3-phosphate acyltransferase PlsY
LFGWPDPRSRGSGHTGGLNVSRGVGKHALVLVMLADLLKGSAAVWLAEQMSSDPWAIPLSSFAAVIGHNWPVWLGFSGGMGLSTAFGTMLLTSPLTPLAALLTLLIVRLFLIKHSPRAVIVSLTVVPLVLIVLREPPPIFVQGTGMALILVLRHLADWNRVYHTDRIE